MTTCPLGRLWKLFGLGLKDEWYITVLRLASASSCEEIALHGVSSYPSIGQTSTYSCMPSDKSSGAAAPCSDRETFVFSALVSAPDVGE